MNIYKKSLVLSAFAVTSCFGGGTKYYPLKQCGGQDSTHTKYQACDLKNVEDYYDVLVDNSAKSDKVILFAIGGPVTSSAGQTIKDYISGKSKKANLPSEYLHFFKSFKDKDISIYLINQMQWLKQAKFKDGNLDKLTYEDGRKEHLETVAKTHDIIKYLKGKGKKVGLAGGSYGSFVVNEYLSQYGDDTPDWVLSFAGRIKNANAKKLESAYATAYVKNHAFVFVEENDKVEDSRNQKPASKFKTKGGKNGHEVQFKIGLKGLTKDYSKSISDQDLSKVTFLTAAPDSRVGWFNSQEISWARGRKAKIDLITAAETRRVLDAKYPKSPKQSARDREFMFKGFAHAVSLWNDAQIKKYYIDPFSK